MESKRIHLKLENICFTEANFTEVELGNDPYNHINLKPNKKIF